MMKKSLKPNKQLYAFQVSWKVYLFFAVIILGMAFMTGLILAGPTSNYPGGL